MSKRQRDVGRKYLSGNMKRTLAKVKKTEAEKEKGALDKYLSKSVDLFETEKSDKQVESDDSEINISKEITSEEASSSFLSGCNADKIHLNYV